MLYASLLQESYLYLYPSTFLLVTGVLIDELREEVGHIEGAHRERNLSIKIASALPQCLDPRVG